MAGAATMAEDLSEEKGQVLREFQEIVGKDDMEECIKILEKHNWNMEAAVQSVFSELEGVPSAYDNNESTEASSSIAETNPTLLFRPGSRATDVHRRNTWYDWLMRFRVFHVFHFGASFTYHCVSEFFFFVMRIVWPGFGRAITSPIEDLMKFREEFEKEYGEIHPTFYMGSYAQVLSDAKKELKFLLVYLHSANHYRTPDFCRNVLCQPNFRLYTQNKNLLFWACDVNSNEGYKVSRAMRETSYPFLAIVCIRDNRMTIVWRIEGPMELDPLIAVCEQVFNDNEVAIVAARAERQERQENREIRKEQDAAFYESSEKDRQKRIENEKRLEKEREAERTRKEKEEEKEKKQQDLARRREECREKFKQLKETSPTAEDSLRIRLKMPHGEILQRYFLKTDELKILFEFALSCEDSPAEFQLCSNFPVKNYLLEGNEEKTLESMGITQPTMLFVQDLSCDSSDDEEDEN